jgi:hypothetical protein
LRPVSTPKETLVEIIPISKKKFTIEKDGTISLDYPLLETTEYIFQFGKINSEVLRSSNIEKDELLKLLEKSNGEPIEKTTSITVDATTDLWSLSSRCVGNEEVCSREAILHDI